MSRETRPDRADYWPVELAGEAIEALGRACGLEPRSAVLPEAPAGLAEDVSAEFLEAWVEDVSACLGFDSQLVLIPHGEAIRTVRENAPLLLVVPGETDNRLLVVVRGRGNRLEILSPAGRRRWIDGGAVRDELIAGLEAPFVAEVERVLAVAGIDSDETRREMLRARLGARTVSQGYTFDALPRSGLLPSARRLGLLSSVADLALARAAQYAFFVLSWWLLGRGVFSGSLEQWLWPWAGTLGAAFGLRVLAIWVEGEVALRGGLLIRRRLLMGALRLKPEEVRTEGSGRLLGRVVESEALETLSMSGGLLALVATIELVSALLLLSLGAGGGLHAVLLLAWCAVALAMGKSYLRGLTRWVDLRLTMTHDLFEAMTGHATRLAQQRPECLHKDEDPLLARYVELSSHLDRRAALLETALPRLWMLIGVVGLAVPFVSGGDSDASLAVGLGGVLMAFAGFQRLAVVIPQLTGAWVAWCRVKGMFTAATREPERSLDTLALLATPRVASQRPTSSRNDEGRHIVLDAADLVFRHQSGKAPAIRGCSLTLSAGDRVLLEGPSGGGKSTLAALLTGLRQPESGLLLFEGLDQRTIGPERWRRFVAAAPQFHENHVLSGTLAFNLLMGRRWPPRVVDEIEAVEVCEELGLGELLERMPSGLNQVVGETGWQLSHGERSRVFLARALLQGADVVVLDESFAALDPETLTLAVQCVRGRAKTLVVIAHP